MLYHKLYWGGHRGAEFLLGAAPSCPPTPFEPPLSTYIPLFFPPFSSPRSFVSLSSTVPFSFSPIFYIPFSRFHSQLPAAWCTRKIKLPSLADRCNVFWGGEGHYCAGLWSRSRRLGLATVSRCTNVSSRSPLGLELLRLVPIPVTA